MKIGTVVLQICESVFIAALWFQSGNNMLWIVGAWIVATIINYKTRGNECNP